MKTVTILNFSVRSSSSNSQPPNGRYLCFCAIGWMVLSLTTSARTLKPLQGLGSRTTQLSWRQLALNEDLMEKLNRMEVFISAFIWWKVSSQYYIFISTLNNQQYISAYHQYQYYLYIQYIHLMKVSIANNCWGKNASEIIRMSSYFSRRDASKYMLCCLKMLSLALGSLIFWICRPKLILLVTIRDPMIFLFQNF